MYRSCCLAAGARQPTAFGQLCGCWTRLGAEALYGSRPICRTVHGLQKGYHREGVHERNSIRRACVLNEVGKQLWGYAGLWLVTSGHQGDESIRALLTIN